VSSLLIGVAFMTDNAAPRAELTLLEMLAARARGASDGRLVLDVLGGLTIAIVFVLWRPAAWLVPFSVSLCFLTFGAWGISDRELGERAVTGATSIRTLATLRAVRAGAAVIGAISAVLAVLAAFAMALGTWIS
jgi:hypothetical protein